MKIKNIPKLTVILGVILLIIAYLIPYDSLEFILGQGLRPLGLVSLYINPILGIIGFVFSVYNKQWLYLVFNIVLILSFFAIMIIGYSFRNQ